MKFIAAKQHAKAFLFGMKHPIIAIKAAGYQIADGGIKNMSKEDIIEAAGATFVVGVPCAVYFSLKHKIGVLTEENEILTIERDTYRIKNQVAYNALKAIAEDRELTETEKEVMDVCDAWQSLEQIRFF